MISFRFPINFAPRPDLLDKIRSYSKYLGISQNKFVRDALEEYINKYDIDELKRKYIQSI